MGSIATAALSFAVAGYIGVAHAASAGGSASAGGAGASGASSNSGTGTAGTEPGSTGTGTTGTGATGSGSSFFLDAFGYASDGSTSSTDTPGSASLIGPLTFGGNGSVSGSLTLTYANVGGMDSCTLPLSSSTVTDNGDGSATMTLNVGGTNPIEFTVLGAAVGGVTAATGGTSTTSGTTMARTKKAGASGTAGSSGGTGAGSTTTGASGTTGTSGTGSSVSGNVDLMVTQTASTNGPLGISCGGTAGPIIATLLHGDMTCVPNTGATGTALNCSLGAAAAGASTTGTNNGAGTSGGTGASGTTGSGS
jgi:hypothetical protein